MSAKFDFSALNGVFQRAWPVKVNVPQDGGGIAVETFSATLRLLTKDETTAAMEAAIVAKADPQKAFVKAFLVDLVDGPAIRDAKGEDLPFLDVLLQPPFVMEAMGMAYSEFINGVAAKN